MKQLVLVRHAESGWSGPFGKDIDRVLTSKGQTDAMQMAFRLKSENIIPERFITSNAKRAFETAKIFAETLEIPIGDISIEKSLYEPVVQSFYKIIEGIPERYERVALFSHNPGITGFLQDFNLIPHIQMPPCGVFAIRINSSHWKDFRISEKSFLLYAFPSDIN